MSTATPKPENEVRKPPKPKRNKADLYKLPNGWTSDRKRDRDEEDFCNESDFDNDNPRNSRSY